MDQRFLQNQPQTQLQQFPVTQPLFQSGRHFGILGQENDTMRQAWSEAYHL